MSRISLAILFGEIDGSGYVCSLHLEKRLRRAVPFASPFLPFENIRARARMWELSEVEEKQSWIYPTETSEKIYKIAARRVPARWALILISICDIHFHRYKSMNKSESCYETYFRFWQRENHLGRCNKRRRLSILYIFSITMYTLDADSPWTGEGEGEQVSGRKNRRSQERWTERNEETKGIWNAVLLCLTV